MNRQRRSKSSLKVVRRGRLISLVVLALMMLAISVPIYAFEGRNGDDVTVAAGETVEDDLYIGAQRMIIDGTVDGDLFFGATEAVINGTVTGNVYGGAATITINGTVEGDLMAGGQVITINGAVQDDLRVGATSLALNGGSLIGGDLMVGGFDVQAKPESNIGGDVLLGAAQARLAGKIGKDVSAAVNGLEILGTIAGDLDAQVGVRGEEPPFNPSVFMQGAPQVDPIPGGLKVGDSAVIGGKLTYRSPQEAEGVSEAAELGVEFEQQINETTATQQPTIGNYVRTAVSRIIALVLLGLLLAWLLRHPILRAASELNNNLAASTVWGIITAIVTPVVLIIAAGILIALGIIFGLIQLGLVGSTLAGVGIPTLLFIATGFAVVWGLISKVIVGYWLGSKIIRGDESYWMPLIVGIVIVAILSSIPFFVGTLFNIVIAILGLGATWLTIRKYMDRNKEPLPVI